MKQTTSHSSYVALDLLRSLAALTVFLTHVRGASFVEFGALPIEDRGLVTKVLFGVTRLGHEAVMVFFVLSGFLVGGQIVRHVREGRFDVRAYALDRATRIFLPLLPAVLLTVGINWFVFGAQPDGAQAFLNIVGLNGVLASTLQNNAPLWSLAFEIWFYVLGGAVGYLLTKNQRSLAVLLALTLSVLVFCSLSATYLLFWGVGALSVLLLDHERRRSFALVGLMLAVFGCVCYELAAESKSFTNVILLSKPVSEGLICTGLSLIIPFCCDDRTNSGLCFLKKPVFIFKLYFLQSIFITLSNQCGLR